LIVVDASTLVGAALFETSVPSQAVLHAALHDRIALSLAVDAEIARVLRRPKLMRGLRIGWREDLLFTVRRGAAWFEPVIPVADCRDPTDDMYLELALAAAAGVIVSSDKDLLVLDPWRGVRILTAKRYLERVGVL
jgi:putative PIN family toxin of toxin-antitoxin system